MRLFQSTRPRGARLFDDYVGIDPSLVSIHAPAWGATQNNLSFCDRRSRFQSTRPRGARLASELVKKVIDNVSIHAPAWGATSTIPDSAFKWTSFNPRARVGRDGYNADTILHILEFQSTRPRGARLTPIRRWLHLESFNPRARVGRDIQGDGACRRSDSFNPRARVGRDFPLTLQ